MMNAQRVSTFLPEIAAINPAFPLLDDGFDTGEEEIFDHSELSCLHGGHPSEEDFSL